jgi:hypothetical protein
MWIAVLEAFWRNRSRNQEKKRRGALRFSRWALSSRSSWIVRTGPSGRSAADQMSVSAAATRMFSQKYAVIRPPRCSLNVSSNSWKISS